MIFNSIFLLQLDSILSTINDMSFVIKVIALVYLIYVFYITFGENQIIFLGVTLIASYFILFHSPVILTIAIIAFIAINPYFFQNISFGLQSVNDVRGMMSQDQIQNRLSSVAQALERGEQVSPQDIELYNEYTQNQQNQQGMQQQDINSHMMRMMEARRR